MHGDKFVTEVDLDIPSQLFAAWNIQVLRIRAANKLGDKNFRAAEIRAREVSWEERASTFCYFKFAALIWVLVIHPAWASLSTSPKPSILKISTWNYQSDLYILSN